MAGQHPDLPDIIVLRHGESAWNAARRWQGALDSELTERGVAQARALGAMFARLGLGPPAYRTVSSPQGRAMATAAILFGAQVPQDANLREIGVGGWTGRSLDEILADPRLPPDPDMLTLYAAAPGGEGFAALEVRCRQVLARLDGPSILVTHGIAGRMLRLLAQGRDLADLPRLTGGQDVAFAISDGVETVLRPTPQDIQQG